MALFVTALVAIAGTAMMYRLHLDIRRTELLLNHSQAYFYAEGSLAWAIDQLNNDWKNKKPNQIIDKTPIYSPVNKINGAAISSVIYDAQSYFNINNLTDKTYQMNFIQLIQAVDPEIELAKAQTITAAVVDWISPTAKDATNDEYYLKYQPPYRAAHRLMMNKSELRLVRYITPALYAKLSPYLIALPAMTPVSVNNAKAILLMSLGMQMELKSAIAIENSCKQTPFATTQSFLNFDIVKNNLIPEKKITVTSNYFLVQTTVDFGHEHFMLNTLVQRMLKDSQSIIVILSQNKGML